MHGYKKRQKQSLYDEDMNFSKTKKFMHLWRLMRCTYVLEAGDVDHRELDTWKHFGGAMVMKVRNTPAKFPYK